MIETKKMNMENIVKKEKKLYKVTLTGMTHNSTGIAQGISYVVAHNSEEAYLKVKKKLDEKDYGFSRDRELKSVELMASDNEYNNTGAMLHL